MPVLDGIWERVLKCAQAGALATETQMEMELVSAVYNYLPNDALTSLQDLNLRRVGGVAYTAEEQACATRLAATFPHDNEAPPGSQDRVQPPKEGVEPSSGDLGDVSWLVPTASLVTATYVPGTPGHSWQATACAGGTIGRKGMLVAAKTLALTALDLLGDPRHVDAARQSFEARRGGHVYRSRLPEDAQPPLRYRDP